MFSPHLRRYLSFTTRGKKEEKTESYYVDYVDFRLSLDDEIFKYAQYIIKAFPVVTDCLFVRKHIFEMFF